ncbi:MAG: oxygen-insensitive NAD(P)H nitroreductase [Alphaproteobacteria bacterium]|nr:oxygen-insensitive NAD(P)H nitroreductase [Alphaproteobacteria bacterium]
MNLTAILQKRYSTKKFDNSKVIATETWQQMEDALRLAASSVNSQPWHFIITSSDTGKQRMLKGTEKYAYNAPKITDASHVVLFCAKTEMGDSDIARVLDKEESDGRYSDPEFKQQSLMVKQGYFGMQRDAGSLQHWAEKQTYLNVGNALLSAALLDIDAVPMEGIDIDALNAEFNLSKQGLTALVMVSFGYRAADDFNASLPKSRLASEDIITRV